MRNRRAFLGTAWRRAAEKGCIDEAVAELRLFAGGRDDLLAQGGYTSVGSWCARPPVDIRLLLIGNLINGVSRRIDCVELTRWTRFGYDRAGASADGTSSFGTPSHQHSDRR